GAVAELVLDERLLVEVEHHRQPLVVRAAGVPDEDLRLREKLEPADRRGDEGEEDYRAQQGHGDVLEEIPLRGAVDLRGLVEVVRDRLQAGEVDDGVVAGPAPDNHRRDRDLDTPRLVEPGDALGADALETGVQEAELVAEDR